VSSIAEQPLGTPEPERVTQHRTVPPGHAGGLRMSDDPRPPAPRRRLGSALLIASLAIALLGTGTVLAQSGGGTPASSGPDQMVSSSPLPNAPIVEGDGATLITVNHDLVDLRPQPWDSITVSADGRTLTVYFYGGLAACYGLGRVDVSSDNGHLKVTLFSGRVPGSQVCAEIAQLYKTVITLEQPLITDGANVVVN
jgi:hypothetical protein